MTSRVRNALRMFLFPGICIGLTLLAFAADSIGQRGDPRTPQQSAPQVGRGQSATLLPDGTWLLLGGGDKGSVSAQAARLNTTTGSRTVLNATLSIARTGQTATVLPDGSVLIVGGTDRFGQPVAEVERFNPGSNTFENLGDAGIGARTGHSATLLTDGRVLIAGGTDVSSLVHDDAVLLDSTALRVVGSAGKLHEARTGQEARLLPSGDVLITGGRSQRGDAIASGEIFRAKSGRFDGVAAKESATLAAQGAAGAPALAEALPVAETADVPVDSRLALRFSSALLPESLSRQSVTLLGPGGEVDARVVAAEGGLLAFISPQQQLVPGSRYTLFVRGAKDARDRVLPLTAIGFDTQTLRAPSSSSRTAQNPNQPLVKIEADDTDGEIWVPAKRNLTGVWRKGGAGEARRHRPRGGGQNKLPQAPAGVTAVAGQVLRLNGAPLERVTLSIGSRTATTDANGEFLLAQVPAGTQTLVIDGSTANAGPRQYGRYEYRAVIEAGKTTALPFVIWMTRLDSTNAVRLPSPTAAETVVTNPRIPGLELRIPAGTVIRDAQGRNVTQVTMTAIPVDQPPFPLPNHQVPVYFTIQPGGAHLQGLTVESAKGARLIYPNFANSPAGSRIDFWNYDPREKGWYVYGQGTVSADGKQVVPDAGVAIYEFTGAMIALPSTAPGEGPPPGGCESGSANSAEKSGDPVDCFTGLFVHDRTDLLIHDTLPIEVRRTYRPRDSASRAFGIGTNLSYDIFLIGDTIPWTYQELILPDGGRVRYNRTSPGTEFRDAVYSTSTPGPYFGSTIRWNNVIDSGWFLTFPDGRVYTFPESFQSASARCAAVNNMRDRFGNAVTVARDTNCNLTSVTSPNGRKLNFTYDTSNRITQITDDINRSLTYHYDASGRLDQATDPAGKFESYTYDTSHRMLTVTDKRGNVMVTNTYDANGRVSQQTYADSTTTGFSYVLSGSVVTQMDFTDERGTVKRVQFNNRGLPTSITYALGKTEQQTVTIARYAATNLAQTVTDPLGRVTSYQYDSKGNITQVTRLFGTPDASTITYTYEPTFNQLASVTDAAGHTTSFTYDTVGNLSTTTDALGHVTTMTHDAAGLVTSSSRSLGSTTQTVTATYNGGDLSTMTDGLGRTTQFFVDAVGRTTAVKDPLGNLSRTTYDVMNRVTEASDALSSTVQYSYDNNGNLLTFQDARFHVSSYSYDARNRVSTKTDELGHGEAYVYDAIGNVTRLTDRKGQVRGFTYDFLNRPVTAGYGATPSNPTAYANTLTSTYDAGGRLTQIVDSASGTITRNYDSLNRLTQEQTPQGQVTYTYYANSLRHTMAVTGKPTVSYTYDDADRLTQIAQGTAVVAFGYDTIDRRTSLTLPNGVQVGYSYDAAGQLTGITYQNGSTSIGNLTYAYDAGGRRTAIGGSLARLNLPAAVSTASYDDANRLTTWGANALTYDDNGNLTSHGSSTYTWNARDELIATSDGGGTFAYDAVGRRTSRTVSGSATAYLHDGLNPATSNGDFLLGSLGLDEIYARVSPTGTASFLNDALGSTVALTDASGGSTAEFTYDPYGAASKSGTDNTSFRFTGREDDEATQLQYFRSRYYSPRTGRFISSDPTGLAGGPNRYAYVGGDPINSTDPMGLFVDSVRATCVQNPAFCLEIMGQIVRNEGAASGNPCFEQAANEVADTIDTIAAAVAVAQVVVSVTSAVRQIPRAVCCFAADTLVATEDGLRPIEEIQVGDRVWSRDEIGGELALKPVAQTLGPHQRVIWTVTLDVEADQSTHTTSQFETTDDHPWASADGKWVRTDELQPGMPILRASGEPARVISVLRTERTAPAYNLEVEDFHTYFVGESGIWVHNACGPRYSGRYADGQKAYRTNVPRDPKTNVPTPVEEAAGPHTRLQYDARDPNRIYSGTEFDAAGNPVKRIDFAGRGEAVPHQHPYDPGNKGFGPKGPM